MAPNMPQGLIEPDSERVWRFQHPTRTGEKLREAQLIEALRISQLTQRSRAREDKHRRSMGLCCGKRGRSVGKAGPHRHDSHTQLLVTESRIAIRGRNRILLMSKIDDLYAVPLGEVDNQILVGVTHQRKSELHIFAL